MRSEKADDPLITVSCGHRVPRTPILSEPTGRGQRRWCSSCAEYRMSGHAHSGEFAFDFLLELRDEISTREIVVDDPGSEQGRGVVRALGARIRLGKSSGKSAA